MTHTQSIRMVGKTAVIAALMGGSSLAFAQEAAPVVITPPAPAQITAMPTAAPVVVPPPAVSTLPRTNDVVNAAAAQEAAAETSERRNVATTPKAALTTRPVKPLASVTNSAPTSAIAPDPVEPAEPIAPAVDSIMPPPDAIEEAAPVAANSKTANSQDNGLSGEDLTIVGGIAAALAALGLGTAFASRRRRKVEADERQPSFDSHRDFVAPAPIKQDPAFQQFGARPAPIAPAMAPAMAAHASERTMQPKPVISRPDVPVTDPLFSRKVVQTPITDPLFAPRNDVEIPITDPMFAHMSEYRGNSGSSKSAWAYGHQNRPNAGQMSEQTSGEMEPAE